MQWNQNYYEQLIFKVDQFTRKYYINQLIRGSLYFIGLVTIVFIAFNLLENQFYFSKLIRKGLFFSFLALFGTAFWFWVATPILHYFRLGKMINHEEAAKIIGTHFTDVKDKLLNVLQLKSQSVGFTDRSLIEASINQKAAELRPVPFVSAIDLQKNRKYIQYAFLPLLLLGGLMVWNPDVIKAPTSRLIQNDKEFIKAAAFAFVIPTEELKVTQNSDYTLHIHTEGSAIPAEAFIEVDHFQYRMHQDEPGIFSYTFRNVQQDQNFKIFSGDIKSTEHTLQVLMLPQMNGFDILLEYPAYTGKKNETIQNIGDLNVPVGTKAIWSFNTAHAEEMMLRMEGSGSKQKLERKGENEFQISQRILKDGAYTVYLKNAQIPVPDSISYQLNVVPDNYPQINVQQFSDSSDAAIVYLAGDVSDDYGLRNLQFDYIIRHKDGREEPKQSKLINNFTGKTSTFRHQFDMNELNIEPGDHVSYYFEIWDNDAVNGSKSTKSSIQDYRLASIDELASNEEKNNEEIKANLQKSIDETEKLRQKLAEFKDKMRQQKDVDWNNKKDLDKMLKEQEKIQQQFEEAKKKFEENLKNQQQHSNPDEKLLEKQEKLQKMMNESMSEEMKNLMNDIQKLMQELNKDQAIQMSEKFEMKNEDVAKEMDRLLELFKELEFEKNLKEQIDRIKDLAEEQKKLAEKTEKKEESPEELKKKQEDINKKFDEVKQKQVELKKKNEALEKPKPLDDQKKKSDDITKDQKEAKEKLDKKENKEAAEKQKDAAEKMEEMAEEMEKEQEESEKDENAEDIKMIRQLLENLVALSFEQESLIKSFSEVNAQTPRYTALVQDEFRLKDNFKLIEDTLQQLAKRVIQIESFVLDKVSEVNDNFAKSIENLEGRNISQASGHQHRIMKNINDLAVMLAESLDNKQKEQNASCNKPGGGSCNKPSKKKKSSSSCKKPGSGKSGKVPMDKITESQKQMEEGMKGMSKKMKEGQQGSSKEFAEMAAKQAQLRKMLQDLEKERKERGEGSKEMQDIINEMNKTEKELVNKQLSNEAMKRQAEITTKLLDAERAEREREYKEERESETGTNIERKFPPSLEDYLKQRQAETEWFQHISPDLRPFYKKLVENYYQGQKK
ncbi:MAG: DUF4175 family protein [Saprospiraceae bacterium]